MNRCYEIEINMQFNKGDAIGYCGVYVGELYFFQKQYLRILKQEYVIAGQTVIFYEVVVAQRLHYVEVCVEYLYTKAPDEIYCKAQKHVFLPCYLAHAPKMKRPSGDFFIMCIAW